MKNLKIYFFAMDLSGTQNACLGLCQGFSKLGHDVHVMVNRSYASRFAKFGFKEHLLEPSTANDAESSDADTRKQICDNIVNSRQFEPMSRLENLRCIYESDFYGPLVENLVAFEPQIKNILAQDKPDVIIFESDIAPPSILYSGIPYVYYYTSNPLGLFDDPDLPPFTSGFPIDSDRKLWSEYCEAKQEFQADLVVKYQTEMCEKFGFPPLKSKTIIPVSKLLNLYQFPAELDYHEDAKLPENCFRLNNFCRTDEEPLELPEDFRAKIKPGDKLIYLSLGTMGCCNLKLMNRLISILSRTRHHVIVSMGLLADQIELAPNMWGLPALPQTRVLQVVDLFITHGGNNSLVESCNFGVPVIAFPIFYDQFNNGQRLQEKNYGVTLDQHTFQDQELLDAVEMMLNDRDMRERWTRMAARIQKQNSFEEASNEIIRRLEQIEQQKTNDL